MNIPEDKMDMINELSKLCTHLFMTDPEFHARVVSAVVYTRAISEKNGIAVDNVAGGLMMQAAAFAAALADVPVDETLGEEGKSQVLQSMLEANLAHDRAARAVYGDDYLGPM